MKPLKYMLDLVVDRIFSNNLSMKQSPRIFLMITIVLKSDIVVSLPFLTHIFNFIKPLN